MSLFSRDTLNTPNTSVGSLSHAELLAAQQTNTAPLLIDVREIDEWNAGHIPGAIHIPRGILEFKISEVAPDRNTPIALYCRSGGRSTVSANQLIKMGYSNVKNLEGGYLAYNDTPLSS